MGARSRSCRQRAGRRSRSGYRFGSMRRRPWRPAPNVWRVVAQRFAPSPAAALRKPTVTWRRPGFGEIICARFPRVRRRKLPSGMSLIFMPSSPRALATECFRSPNSNARCRFVKSAAGMRAQKTSVPPSGRICTTTSSSRGFTARPERASTLLPARASALLAEADDLIADRLERRGQLRGVAGEVVLALGLARVEARRRGIVRDSHQDGRAGLESAAAILVQLVAEAERVDADRTRAAGVGAGGVGDDLGEVAGGVVGVLHVVRIAAPGPSNQHALPGQRRVVELEPGRDAPGGMGRVKARQGQARDVLVHDQVVAVRPRRVVAAGPPRWGGQLYIVQGRIARRAVYLAQ